MSKQLDNYLTIQANNDSIKQGRDFDHVLSLVGRESFGKSDLNFYFRTLGEIEDRVQSSRSLIKTYIQTINRFTKAETKEAISKEAREILDQSFAEISLLLKEISIGKESEFSQLNKEFRRRLK